ncbi:MAG: hypothetical protein HC915_17990 [Anaerolineae bacterium]|nr:hypothetical protein [Anaerolineae bacterium]
MLDPTQGGGNINLGQTVQGALNNNVILHEWFFEGVAGDRIRITMRDITPNQGLDPLLILFNPNRSEIARVDDIGDLPIEGLRSTDAVIEIDLRATGFYTIQAARFGGRGDYELTLESLTQP